jgi:hypothetical protein
VVLLAYDIQESLIDVFYEPILTNDVVFLS